jgi:cell wall-associated NlpC family hydrolase
MSTVGSDPGGDRRPLDEAYGAGERREALRDALDAGRQRREPTADESMSARPDGSTSSRASRGIRRAAAAGLAAANSGEAGAPPGGGLARPNTAGRAATEPVGGARMEEPNVPGGGRVPRSGGFAAQGAAAAALGEPPTYRELAGETAKTATAAAVASLTGIAQPVAKKGVDVVAAHTARPTKFVLSGVALLLSVVLLAGSVGAVMGGGVAGQVSPAPSPTALAGIPAAYLAVYQNAGLTFDVPWAVLAAIGTIETQNGETSPYDQIVRGRTPGTSIYEEVSPPIGGTDGEAAGPFLVTTEGVAMMRPPDDDPQNVVEAADFLAYQLELDGEALAQRRHVAYANELDQPLTTTSAFWATAVGELPVSGSSTCAPVATTSIPLEIEAAFACNSAGRTLYLADGPGQLVPAGDAPAELTAEALDAAWGWSRFGKDSCSAGAAVAGVFPSPPAPGLDRCDDLADIEAVAQRVVSRAAVPISSRPTADPAYEWGWLGETVAPFAGFRGWWPTASCAAALGGVLSALPEPGPFSPPWPGATLPANRLSAAWRTSTLAALRSSPWCAPASEAAFEGSVFRQATMLYGELATEGGIGGRSDLAGLISYLGGAVGAAPASYGTTSLVPRLSSSPVAVGTPAVPPAPPAVEASFPAEVLETAETFVAGLNTGSQPLGGQQPGVPPPSGPLSYLKNVPAALVTDFVNGWRGGCPRLYDGWAFLASIAAHESGDQGSTAGYSTTGAYGLMQFEPATFAGYVAQLEQMDIPGGATPPTRANDADEVYAAALMLCTNGAASGTLGGLDQAMAVYASGDGTLGPGGVPVAFSFPLCGSCAETVGEYVASEVELADRYLQQASGGELPAGAGGAPGSGPGPAAVIAAELEIGQPYADGGSSPRGFDDGGLVAYAYRAAGVGLPASDAAIFTATKAHRLALGTDPAAVPLGALCFYGPSTSDVHLVGVYVGSGEIVTVMPAGVVGLWPYGWSGLVAITTPES